MYEYLNLRIGAPRRLAYLRTSAQRLSEKFPSGSAATWRTVRYATLKHAGDLAQGMRDDAPIWCAHTGPVFPREKYADECYQGIRHEGWFTDTYQEEKARGVVVNLPHGKFLAGYEWSANDERVYFPEIFDSETDAASQADGHAERFAEACLEDSRRVEEAQELEYEAQKLANALAEKLALRNDPRFPDAREEAHELLTELRELRERLQNDFADYI